MVGAMGENSGLAAGPEVSGKGAIVDQQADRMQNPKLEGSLIIDAIPQTGECPLCCSQCFYNAPGFYRTLEKPLIPTAEEALNKIVRVNSGNDSNVKRDLVIAATKDYPRKFYNTSVPRLDFGAPVVLTINGRDTDKTFYAPSDVKGKLEDLMFVRFRADTWNLELCDDAVDLWCVGEGIPLVLTTMRYYDRESVKRPGDYLYKKHILNESFSLKTEALRGIFARYSQENLVFYCGNPVSESTMCADCRVCEHTFDKALLRVEANQAREKAKVA